MQPKKEVMKTDVLIIGGGIAGCMAAIGAREKSDVDVLILEKAYVSRSGDAGAGNDHLLAHLNTGEEWDTDQAMCEYYTRLSQGFTDIDIPYRLHISIIKKISEIQIGGITGSLSGLVIDKRGRTNLSRLYAAGACTVPSYALAGALSTGYSVGMEAGKSALGISKGSGRINKQIEKEILDVYTPLRRKKGAHYKRFENRLRQIMFDYVVYQKTEKGLKTGLKKLEDLESRADEIKAENTHELMRVSEFKDLLLIGKLVSIAALKRRESRMGLAHIRGDYPDQDDEHFNGSILLSRMKNGRTRVTFKPAVVK